MEIYFGDVPGVKVGQCFKNRKELREAGIHAPLMAGIWGAQEGACSIVLSGGYEDDIDDLDFIRYTGQGGQNDKKQQVADQEFTFGNRGLQLSCDYKSPVRVTRGYQIMHGPEKEKGYRYDGIYFVEKYERIKGKSGFYICRFHLQSQSSIDILENDLRPNLKSNYSRTTRTSQTIQKINRSIKNREKIKSIYDYRCQVCEIKLNTPKKFPNSIAIGAHIKGLGRPHNGPDELENMLCLCPNHHEQFDKFSYYIDPMNLEVKGLSGLENKKILTDKSHKIDPDFLQYHYDLYLKNN